MNVSRGTIMRTIFLGVTLALTDIFFIAMLVVLMKLGLITELAAGGYATTLVGANIAAARAYWKNNSWTQDGLEADEFLAEIRKLKCEEGDVDDEEIDSEM